MFVSTSSVAAALALLAARSALALPSAPPFSLDAASKAGRSSLKLVHYEAVEHGILAVYNDESLPVLDLSNTDISEVEARRSSSNTTLERRCGSNNVVCDFTNNRAPAWVCGQLMDYLGEPANRNKAVEQRGYTSQCLWTGIPPHIEHCCISWSARVPGLYTNYLFPAVEKMLPQCVRDGLVSAKATDVQLAVSCVAQCLSDQQVGCAW
jgi:hypothetical protein